MNKILQIIIFFEVYLQIYFRTYKKRKLIDSSKRNSTLSRTMRVKRNCYNYYPCHVVSRDSRVARAIDRTN